MSDRPTVFIVDDDEGIRVALDWSLRQENFRVESFPSAEAFLGSVGSERPGCLVLDIRMQGMTGLDLQEVLTVHGYQIPIIFMTGHGDIPTTVKALKAGAVDFVEKPLARDVLIERIREALREDERRRLEAAARTEVRDRYQRLTPREREVMGLVTKGLSNKEIARVLTISPRTVENHRARVMTAMQADNLATLCHLAGLCARAGVLGEPPQRPPW